MGDAARGPLDGVKVVQLAGIGPVPFCGMVLSDLGADVVRVDRVADAARTDQVGDREDGRVSDHDLKGVEQVVDGILVRGRRSVALDLKHADGVAVALDLIASADVVIEGLRPGATERLGLGPDVCRQRNPRLVYGRLTGWGQDGPAAQSAGHDLNYIALTGMLAAIGPRDRPSVPLNVVGDFAGGGMLLAMGVLAATVEATRSGQGQVVDAAMLDGSAYLMTMIYELLGKGLWREERESNINDGGAHFYGVYETADGGHLAVAPMEPRFHAELVEGLGLDVGELPDQWDPAAWPELRARFAQVFLTRTRDEWTEVFDGTDACVTPVLTMSEATAHPHNVARRAFIDIDGATVPAPAPRFARTPAPTPGGASRAGEDTVAVLRELGLSEERVAELLAAGAVAAPATGAPAS